VRSRGRRRKQPTEPQRIVEDLVLESQPLFAVGVNDHLGPALAIGRVHILVPQEEGLEHVTGPSFSTRTGFQHADLAKIVERYGRSK
jgi:hypothetical protein